METNWNEKLQKAASFGIVILGISSTHWQSGFF